MNKYIVYFLVVALITPLSFAQQNKSTPEQEIELLKKQVAELQNKLQTVENVEKMELAAKLAEAQAKLINADIDKLKLELKDSNQQWIRNWIFIILGILSVVGFALWKWLTTKMDGLIENEVNKRLTDFEGAIEKVKILEPKVRILNKEHAASVLERFRSYRPEHVLPSEIRATLLDKIVV